MHKWSDETVEFSKAFFETVLDRCVNVPPSCPAASDAQLAAFREQLTVTAAGHGLQDSLDSLKETLPFNVAQDHKRAFAFVGLAPTPASLMADWYLAALNVCATSHMEAGGLIAVENAAIGWLLALAGLDEAGPRACGVFVSGGSAANLNALCAARRSARSKGKNCSASISSSSSSSSGGGKNAMVAAKVSRPVIVCASGAHSSFYSAASVMDAHALRCDTREQLEAIPQEVLDNVIAVCCTVGTTNDGLVDDLQLYCEFADGAMGGAFLAVPEFQDKWKPYTKRANSMVINPHKLLFSTYDCSCLLYADAGVPSSAHRQEAAYLDVLQQAEKPPNPCDLANHLTRRARGVPFWFSLYTYGTDAYTRALQTLLDVTREAAEAIRSHPLVQLVTEPQLCVLVFECRAGWSLAKYEAWSEHLRANNGGFVVPTSHDGRACLRICIVNPQTEIGDIQVILKSLEDYDP